jgi:hypothetical protein
LFYAVFQGSRFPASRSLIPLLNAGERAEPGVDRSGKKGADIKKCLLSPNTMEYLTALQKLFTVWLTDGPFFV